MRGRMTVFILAGLGLSLCLALLVSPFASSSPDGLDRFAEDQQLLEGEAAWTHAPMSGYQVAQVKHERLSTGLAGVTGTLAVFGAACALGWMVRRRRVSSETTAEVR